MPKKPNALQQAYPEIMPLIAETEAAIGALALTAYRQLRPRSERRQFSRHSRLSTYSSRFCFLPTTSAGKEESAGLKVQSVSLVLRQVPITPHQHGFRAVQVGLSKPGSTSSDEYGVTSTGQAYAGSPLHFINPISSWQKLSLYESQVRQADLSYCDTEQKAHVRGQQIAVYSTAANISALVARALVTTFDITTNQAVIDELQNRWTDV